jgi:hypothetical protein
MLVGLDVPVGTEASTAVGDSLDDELGDAVASDSDGLEVKESDLVVVGS